MATKVRWVGLDHVRAVAALMVFTWHFSHGTGGYPVAFAGAPAVFPLSLLDEGHTGVALFMVLSGYLFAKIADGKQILLRPFFLDRFIRLAPVLVVAIILTGLVDFAVSPHRFNVLAYAASIAEGVVRPTLPSGGWSITVEAHFYIILPLLLIATARWKWAPIAMVVAAIAFRTMVYAEVGTIQDLSYWTIVGHIDQFLIGIFAYNARDAVRAKPGMVFAALAGFIVLFTVFDAEGGFYGTYRSAIWVILPTIEAVAYAALITWYDGLRVTGEAVASRVVALFGKCSYSIYLLHPLIVFREAKFIDRHIMHLDNMYVAFAWSVACFALMLPLGWLSFTFIEEPIRNRWHRKYLIRPEPSAVLEPA